MLSQRYQLEHQRNVQWSSYFGKAMSEERCYRSFKMETLGLFLSYHSISQWNFIFLNDWTWKLAKSKSYQFKDNENLACSEMDSFTTKHLMPWIYQILLSGTRMQILIQRLKAKPIKKWGSKIKVVQYLRFVSDFALLWSHCLQKVKSQAQN